MRKELEVILNSTHDAMIAINKYGVITLFNKAAEYLTGINKDYALNREVEKVILNTRLNYILETGDFELNREQDLGNIKIITNRMPVKNEKNEVIGAVAVFRDITEIQGLSNQVNNLKEMQSMLEGIFYATQDAISVVDKNGINLMINPAYTRLTGLSEKDIIGKIATADIAEGESIHLKVLETKSRVKNTKIKVGPNRKEVIANAAPIIVDDELKGSVGVLHDVSDIMKATDELNLAKKIIRSLEAKYTFEDIVGNNILLKEAIEKAKKAADVPATVLLRGESGTGKELFAHAIHNASDRKFNQFVKVNCAALSESLLESELFGYVEGAFTGAKKSGKKGLFEQASGGTIFLDEIGEVSSNIQVKLLRVLQEKEIIRVGDTESIDIDIRIIGATNMDLEKAVEEGNFREDLYYRLNVLPIIIPALRYRKDDLGDLVYNSTRKLNQEYGRAVNDISDEALEILKKHDWPGNVRELENIVGRAIINMRLNENKIEKSHLPKITEKYKENMNMNIETRKHEQSFEELNEILDSTEKEYITKVLDENKGNKTLTAKILGISIRSLYYKLERHGI
ncbi:MAG: sigma 54-interacting transcriptional regulator [Senegalia sp. (in: firmicutes)]|uniref:sigma-54 interaction domain-containing protein n=1 Tax=Senegalia sp. (in: firmicutes) TaxID=1924098 RepID=UPI003F9DDF87